MARRYVMIAAAALWGGMGAVQAAETLPPGVFAIVGEQTVPMDAYEARLQAALRRTFYHGNAPAERVAAYRRDVAQALVDRVLLLQEAQRRGLKPDADQVERGVAQYRERHGRRAEGAAGEGAQMEGQVRRSLEEDNLIARLETQVKGAPPAAEVDVQAYYAAHPDKFTTPARWRVSMILLKVEPSSSPGVWQAAQEEVQRIQAQLDKRADFATLARIHSGDGSGQSGGDLGYVHEGMLAPDAERAIKDVKVGAVTPPVLLLQGVALFRVVAYDPPQRNDYVAVAARARTLFEREREERAWQQLLKDLRATTPVSMSADLQQ